jgi:exodeoxyribonuclease VII large subunit
MQEIEMGVADLTKRVILALERDELLNDVTVRGELSNFKYSGPHAYFSMKEGDYLLNCVMFNAIYKMQNREIRDGAVVKASGSIKVYSKKGYYQLYAESIREGTDYGELYKKLEALKLKLTKAGIFDKPKKQIPLFPKQIAVVSSKTSAAFHDVVKTVRKRYPITSILLFHTSVQGEDASSELVKALDAADRSGSDVVLLVRGGGSIEDLWNFNEEIVVKKVYDMKTPVISGVGHEVDFTLVDYVADFRAPTPTGAAERATPDILDLKKHLNSEIQGISSRIASKLNETKRLLEMSKGRLNLLSPSRILLFQRERIEGFLDDVEKMMKLSIRTKRNLLLRDGDALGHSKVIRTIEFMPERLDSKIGTIKNMVGKRLDMKRNDLEKAELSLNTYDPMQPLKRGYAMIFKGDKLVRSIFEIKMADEIETLLADGKILSKVEEIKDGREKNR